MDKDVDPKCVFEAIDKNGNNNNIICMSEFGLMFSDSDPTLPMKLDKCKETNDVNKGEFWTILFQSTNISVTETCFCLRVVGHTPSKWI